MNNNLIISENDKNKILKSKEIQNLLKKFPSWDIVFEPILNKKSNNMKSPVTNAISINITDIGFINENGKEIIALKTKSSNKSDYEIPNIILGMGSMGEISQVIDIKDEYYTPIKPIQIKLEHKNEPNLILVTTDEGYLITNTLNNEKNNKILSDNPDVILMSIALKIDIDEDVLLSSNLISKLDMNDINVAKIYKNKNSYAMRFYKSESFNETNSRNIQILDGFIRDEVEIEANLIKNSVSEWYSIEMDDIDLFFDTKELKQLLKDNIDEYNNLKEHLEKSEVFSMYSFF